ncbi:cytochrome P450 [Streptomyces lydicus]|uniref:Cytochrome n=1 Tax=Streptomyces lydicus TaxID=47763 RepID=A0A1D7VNE6_9ACTN|nr:cytochrome P450 [Streptomyces lydicus]AOP48028.1 cytochrome [Streptomyces lydicus]
MAVYERLREEYGAVAPVRVHDDLPAWLVLGYRENVEVARNEARYSRDPQIWREALAGRVRADHPLSPMITWWPVVNFTDGAVHRRLSDAIKEALRRFEELGIRRYVDRCALELINRFPNGRVDLVADFAVQLPMLVMSNLIGLPEEAGPRLVEAVPDMLQGTETSVESDRYVTDLLQQLVESKKSHPGHDLTSMLLKHPSQLTDQEVLAHVRIILVAACETTTTLIANTLRMVLTDQRFRAHLSGGQMTLPDAVEQMLWDQPPLNTVIGRWAVADVELGGQQIRAGDMLLLGLAAGNADPVVRPPEDELSAPIYANRSHLSFSKGAHECPGQEIGRSIAQAGVDTLLARLDGLALAVPAAELRRNGTLMSQHLVNLPVTFRPLQATNAATEKGRVPGYASREHSALTDVPAP